MLNSYTMGKYESALDNCVIVWSIVIQDWKGLSGPVAKWKSC